MRKGFKCKKCGIIYPINPPFCEHCYGNEFIDLNKRNINVRRK
jgi:uncharacterized OB-fold protein